MLKNILYIIGIILGILFCYLFYQSHNNQFLYLNKELIKINQSLDSLLGSSDQNGSILSNNTINYRENNIVKNGVINFADSLTQLLEEGKVYKKISEFALQEKGISVKSNIDTICYELSEQYKIINFYSNKIRIKNTLRPGSILMSINDSLVHNDIIYILNEINGESGYIKLNNATTNTHCKFHKVSP